MSNLWDSFLSGGGASDSGPENLWDSFLPRPQRDLSRFGEDIRNAGGLPTLPLSRFERDRPGRDMSQLGSDLRSGGALPSVGVDPREQEEQMYGKDEAGAFKRHARALGAGIVDLASVVPSALELQSDIRSGIVEHVPTLGIDLLEDAKETFLNNERQMADKMAEFRADMRLGADELAPASDGVIDDFKNRQGFLGKASAVTEAVTRGLPSALAVLATGGGAGAVMVGGAIAGLPEYSDAKAEGVDRGTAFLGALGQGVVGGLLERVGIEGVIGNRLTHAAGYALWRDIRNAVLKEGITESLQEANSFAWQKLQGREAGDLSTRMANAFIVGGASGGLMHGAVARLAPGSTANEVAEAREGGQPNDEGAASRRVAEYVSTWRPVVEQYNAEVQAEIQKSLARLPQQIKNADWLIEQQNAGAAFLPDDLVNASPAAVEDARARDRLRSEAYIPGDLNIDQGRLEEVRQAVTEEARRRVQARWHDTFAKVAQETGATIAGDMADATADAATPRVVGPSRRPPVDPNEQVRALARDYITGTGRAMGIRDGGYAPLDESLGKRVADSYESLQHDPRNPEVREAYDNFKQETIDQWNFLTGRGVKFEPWVQEGQPYANSEDMVADVRNNNHLYFFTGGDMPSDHPLADRPGINVNGVDLTFNDVFRAVHDYFGHAKEGYQFGPRGEENAYQTHARMYSKESRRALASETRGQNSWVNFGPHLRRADGSVPKNGDPDFVPQSMRQYAEQKAALLPEEFSLLPEELEERLIEHSINGADKETATPDGHEVHEARGSADLGIRTLDDDEKLFVVKEEGRDVGSLVAKSAPGGFRVRHVFVDEGYRGKSIPESLYRAAHKAMGPYLGSTDYQGRRTPAGERLAKRLAFTAPEIFDEPQIQAPLPDGSAPTPALSSQAGSINPQMLNPKNWKRKPAQPNTAYPLDQDITDYADLQKGGRTFVESLSAFGRRAYDQWFDREAPLMRVAKKVGDDTLPKLVALSRGVSEIARYPITRGTRLYDPSIGGYRYTGRGLKQIIGGADSETIRDLSRYMAAERQLELANRRVKQEVEYNAQVATYRNAIATAQQAKKLVQQRSPDRATRLARMKAYEQARKAIPPKPSKAGFLNVDADAVTRASETKQMIEQKWGTRINELTGLSRDVRDWSRRAVLDPLREVGYLSKERYDAVLRENEQYAPFFRIIEELDGELQPANTTTKKNPIGKIHDDISQGIVNPLESMVLKAQQVQKWVDRQRIRNYLADLSDANPAINEVQQVKNGSKPAKNAPTVFEKKDTFSVFRNGDRYTYRASNEVMSVLDSMAPGQADLIMKGLSFFASLRRAGATLGLGFILRNPLRDQQTAAVNSRYGYVPYLDLVKGMFAASPFAKRMAPHLADYFDEMHAVGALQGDKVSADMKSAAYELEDLTRDRGPGQIYKNVRGLIRREGALFPLQILSRQLELGTRVGSYIRARGKGATQMEAGVEAREITIDFRRYGNTAQKWNSIEAFANAELQDIDIFRQRLMQRPVATGLKVLGYITLPALLNYAMNKDDEEYAQLQEWDKALFYHVHKFSDGSFLRIPRPIGLMNVLFGYGVEKLMGRVVENDPEAGAAFLNQVAESTPLHYVAGAGLENYTPFDPKNYIDLVPTAFEPGVEAAFNYDTFREAPVIPQGEQDILPEFQGEDVLGPSALAMGKAAGISPYVAKHMVEGTFATLGKQGMTLADKAMGQDKRVASDPLGVVTFLGFRSAKPIGFGSRPVTEFYELEKRVSQSRQTMKELEKKGSVDAYLEVAGDSPELVFHKYLSDTKKKLAELRTARRQVMATEGMTPQERSTLLLDIDTMATQLAGTTNMVVREFLAQDQ